MHKLIILTPSLLALPTYANNLMGCDGCTQSIMTQKVKKRASFLPPGVHTINVIDTQNSNFEQFKVTVYSNSGSKTPGRQPRIDIKAVKSPLKRQIEKSLIEAKRGIIDLKNHLSNRIVLNTDSPYKTSAEALNAGSSFSNFIDGYVNNQQSPILATIQEIRAVFAQMAADLNVGVSAIISVSTSLKTTDATTVVFPDGSSIEVNISFRNHLSEGLEVEVKTTERAKTSDGKLIPTDKYQARNFNTSQSNVTALIDWFNQLGLDTHDGGGSCESEGFKCDSKSCVVVYRCN